MPCDCCDVKHFHCQQTPSLSTMLVAQRNPFAFHSGQRAVPMICDAVKCVPSFSGQETHESHRPGHQSNITLLKQVLHSTKAIVAVSCFGRTLHLHKPDLNLRSEALHHLSRGEGKPRPGLLLPTPASFSCKYKKIARNLLGQMSLRGSPLNCAMRDAAVFTI